MIPETRLNFTEEELDVEHDFVAIGSDEDFDHAAFIVQHEEKIYEFDFYNEDVGVKWMSLKSEFYYLIMELIDRGDVPAFVAHCKEVEKHANPKFGYFYSGEYYDRLGNHISDTVLEERMTCVGFCLNVLKGFLGQEYLHYEDWDSTSHYDTEYLKEFCEKTGFAEEDIADEHRRITPLECLTSCYFDTLPIRKSSIDSKKGEVKKEVAARKGA